MIRKLVKILYNYKYEILLVALLAHLYIGIFLKDLIFYTKVVWPVNMLVLGIASIGVFVEKRRIKKIIKNILLVLVIVLPVSLPFFGNLENYMAALSLIYCVFFGFIFTEVLRYLIRPNYIDTDLISASACGVFLLIEVFVFLLQSIFYMDPSAINNIDTSQTAAIYMDLVYFSSVSVTTIGYGDITPNSHSTKLIVSLMGITCQFYTVVLIGIIISKFAARKTDRS